MATLPAAFAAKVSPQSLHGHLIGGVGPGVGRGAGVRMGVPVWSSRGGRGRLARLREVTVSEVAARRADGLVGRLSGADVAGVMGEGSASVSGADGADGTIGGGSAVPSRMAAMDGVVVS